MVRVDVKSDPTLRSGDIVATNDGLVSYRGGNGKSAEFTPVLDRKLSDIQIRPATSPEALTANASAEVPPPKNVNESASKPSRRRAQR